MKLSWRDLVTTALAASGGAVVYAKFYDYSWALIGSWRGAVAVLAAIGLVMMLFSKFDFRDLSLTSSSEMLLGFVAAALAVIGMFVTSQPIFYVVAGLLGTLWLVDTGRHVRHSLEGEEDTTSFHHHVPVH